jgi:Fe-S-cluster containining protein
MSPDQIELDLSQVRERRFTCLEGCELYCLCQPEVMPGEEMFFRTRYPERLVTVEEDHDHLAISTIEGGGPCSFLKGGRCEIYPDRPRFCRQFPLHIYLGERVQPELDLSCRGVWMDIGENAETVFLEYLEENRGEMMDLLMETRRSYSIFWDNCVSAGVDNDPLTMRSELIKEVDRVDMTALARTLEASAEENEMNSMVYGGDHLSKGERDELEEAVMETALVSLTSDSPHEAPVYCDPKGRWHVFEVRGKEIHWQVMGRDGQFQYMAPIDPSAIRINNSRLTSTSNFRDYMMTLVGRDSFWGHVFYLEDMYGYEDHLTNTFMGTLANCLLDLIWRTTMIEGAFNMKEGEESMREGIIFYDMDRLGAPNIGAFF